jgi:diaminopimelate decarboxylase
LSTIAVLVIGFNRQQQGLTCDGVALGEIVRQTGTPVYVYSGATIAERYARLERAVGDYPHRIHYAIKANGTSAVARLMRRLGAAADANSGGEIEVARRAGFTPADIVFTGVGKTRAELDLAVGLGVHAINAESPGELERISALATARGTRARVAFRINPDVDAGSHPHISTGSQGTKFGVTVPVAREMARAALALPGVQLVGLHVHIGSQLMSVEPVARAAAVVCDLARALIAEGIALEHLDLGGGLGIPVGTTNVPMPVETYVETVLAAVRPTGLTLLLEPGRWLVGPAGQLVTSVVDLKRRADGGWFVIVDAGMTDLIRPALYGAWHPIEAVTPRAGPCIQADVVGPVCETSDTLGVNRALPPVEVGDLLAIGDTGAYGAAMASNYNRRPMPAEVLVDAGRWAVVRRRQTVADLLQWDE